MSTVNPHYQPVPPPAPPAPPNAIVAQPAVAQPVVPPATEDPPHQTREWIKREIENQHREALRIYSHSALFYWWPVWVVGFLFAFLTYAFGKPIEFQDGHTELVYAAKWMGVVYTVVIFLTIMISNVTLRGLASVIAVLSILFLVVLFAYLGWWEYILSWLPSLSVHMNLGFYVLFSSLMFIVWAVSTFVYDRMSYWVIHPGQIIHDFVIGGAEKSYDTHGMTFEKNRQDLFRHWILGLGSGDLVIHTMGARKEVLHLPNVLFVDWKVQAIQKMIATRPADFSTPTAA